MTERRVSVRLAAVGGQTLKDDLRAVGREGRAALEAISGGAPAASRGLGEVSTSASAAVTRLEALSAKSAQLAASLAASANATGTLAGRIDKLTGVSAGVTRSADDIAAYGKAMDDLRAKHNPMFAVIRNYRAELENIRQAHRVGAISADEMSAAISRERQAALGSIAALKGRATALTQVGAASRNASWQSRNLLFQLNDVGVSLAGGMNPLMVMVQQGSQISQMYAGQGGVNAALKDTGRMILGVATKHPVLTAAVVALGAALIGLNHEINESTKQTVKMQDTALAVWQVTRDGLMTILKPAIDAIAPWFDAAWDAVVKGVHLVGNAIVNGFRLAFLTVKTIFTSLPSIVGAGVIGAANAVLTAIETLINKALAGLQSMIDGVSGLIAKIPGMEGFSLGSIGTAPPMPKIANPYADDLKEVWANFEKEHAEIQASDPLGTFYENVRKRAIENAKKREEEERKKKNKGGGKTKKEETDEAAKLLEQLTKELAVLQETDPVKKKMLEYSKELAGATAEQRDQVLALVQALDQENHGFNAITRTLKEYAEEAKRIGDDIGDVFVGAFDSMGDAVAEFVKGGKFSFSDLVGSILGDLAKLSIQKTILSPMANALSGALSGLGGSGSGWGAALTSWLHHDGGRVGAGARLSIPAYAIAGAPRFHDGGGFGLRSDEQVSVLQRGERVLNRRQTRDWESGGGTVVNINARDANSFRQSRAQVASDISRAVQFGRRSL